MNDISSLSNAELLVATSKLVSQSCAVEADLLVHLGEIDDRKLYLEHAHPSMFAFCTRELGFSEGAAYNRISVARAARKVPAMIEAVRTGSVHLAGLRLLAPRLNSGNCAGLLAKAAGRTKDEIAELVAALAPRPAPATTMRKLPEPRGLRESALGALPLSESTPSALPASESVRRPPPRAIVPIAEETFKLQLAISREFRDDLREAQGLLRHRIPDGDLATILQAAVKLLVAQVKKERFAIGRKPRATAAPRETQSRHIPDAIKRTVHERDGGRCAFVDGRGNRCTETGALEFDHIDGFARTHVHGAAAIRLLCRAHNQHAADNMYGQAFMDSARNRTRPGTSCERGAVHRQGETTGTQLYPSDGLAPSPLRG